MPTTHLVVHGHFYQPPRENPWTDKVPQEPGAAPFHDWNSRIHAECYRANGWARLDGAHDQVIDGANNYAHMSFNFGPTLARWIARHDPETMARIHAGDRQQQRRLSAGGAMAQVWGHPITPLCSPNDRRTQIAWGMQDFARRFGRPAQGMWLPETAANPATLTALIDAGVRFTILAPEQVAAVRQPGGEWIPVTRDSLDTGRAYLWRPPGRGSTKDGHARALAVCVFDGPLSRNLAFGDAARDSATFLSHVTSSAQRSKVDGARLVLGASDGELYGHHKKFADLTAAYATTVGAKSAGVTVTNLAAFLADQPPTWELQLAGGPNNEGTAWSCGHGLGRWMSHCGCATDPKKNPSQAWREPLRQALDLLRDHAARCFENIGGDLFTDPWHARDAYGQVMDDPVVARDAGLAGHGTPALRRGRGDARSRSILLLEMQRSALLMYASCGWFFDDIAGTESAIVLRRAAHVIDLMQRLGVKPPIRAVLDLLRRGRSNQRKSGSGADVLRAVWKDRVTPAMIAAEAFLAEPSLRRTAADLPDDLRGHQTNDDLAMAGAVPANHRRTSQRVRGPKRPPENPRSSRS